MPPVPPADLASWLASMEERVRRLETELSVFSRTGSQISTAVMVAGSVVVSTPLVTAVSNILLGSQVNAVTGPLRVSARTPGVSFTITSTNAADAGLVSWHIMEPI
jgi:hypothetical protein